jgi:PAS domain S-box-containing protein
VALESAETARSQAEATLRERDARIRAILETTVDGMITIDEQGRIESFNSAAERLFGYSAAEVIGQNVSRLMPSPYREAHEHYLAWYLATGEKKIIGISREVVGLHKDGHTFPIDLAVSEVRLNNQRLFTGIVRDTGVGMAAEARARAFEPFYSTKGERGSGLGLAMCRQLIEHHGGTICLDSTPGAGTTVTIVLVQADAVDAGEGSPAPPHTRG